MLQADSSGLQVKLAELLTEVGHLSAITRKLLLAQADAGHLVLNRSRINLSEQLDNWVADTQMLAAERSVSSDVEPGLPVSADALLLRQLFNNLVSNAVRYGGTVGWIHISARALPGGVEVVIANASSAIGMEQRQRFFDRFYRGDAARNRRSEGSGLGLSLAREIARAHGGDLTLQSSRPDEVRLRLWLPTP